MSAPALPHPGCPTSAVDPFSRAFLLDPYPFHQELREAGPVVHIDAYGLWAMARHAEVAASLNDWQTFCSSAGVGLSDFRKETPWRPPSLVLEADPPLHTRTRTVLARVLSPNAIRELRAGFEREAECLVDRLVAAGQFDGIKDLAEVYPPKVFGDAVGLPAEGRENLLPYGGMAFNAFGPRNELFETAFANAAPVIGWITAMCRRDAVAADGLGARIFQAADSGELSEEEAGLLLRSFLTAGVDTTVNALGNALFCFAEHPDQWALLQANPALARNAFEEVLRFEAAVQTFFRTTTRQVEVSGTTIPEGAKVLLFLGAANRDPRAWQRPDNFDINRRVVGQMGFGTGIHGCVGQMVARLEGEIILASLARKVRRIERNGPLQRRLNNTLRGLDALPLRVTPV